jgi:hypothetical protein
MKNALIHALAAISIACGTPSLLAGDLTRVFYPNQKEAVFTVDVPSDWKMIPQGEAGAEDYFEVEGPNGLELSFRIVPGADIEQAVKNHIAYLNDNFTEVKVEDAKETKINGMEALLAPGKGKDENGSVREFGAGWFDLGDGRIGELWYNVAVDDKSGTDASIKVLNSLAKGGK